MAIVNYRCARVCVLLLGMMLAAISSADANQTNAHEPVVRRELRLDTDPSHFRYGLEVFTVPRYWGNAFSWTRCFDADGDGDDELIIAFTTLVGAAHSSAVLILDSPLRNDAVCQYNGAYPHALIHDAQLIDMIGDSVPELVLVKVRDSNPLIEILEFTGDCLEASVVIPIDIRDTSALTDGWQALHIKALACVDLNMDGHRDIIFSQSGKPDSAMQRAIVAWDPVTQQELWSFDIADLVAPGNFHVLGSESDPILAFVTASCANRYSANGMHSRNAYVLAVDAQGRELWRHQVATSFFYASSVVVDVDGDGYKELLCTWDPEMAAGSGAPEIKCLDPPTGDVLAVHALEGQKRQHTIHVLSADSTAPLQITVTGDRSTRGTRMFVFDETLRLTDIVEGDISSPPIPLDLLELPGLELVVQTPHGHLAVLDRHFRSQAIVHARGPIQPVRLKQQVGLFRDDGFEGYQLLLPFKRSMIAVLFARYKWWLAALVGSMLALLIWRAGQTVWKWREAAIGLPTLNHIGSMVLLLDRKGRIIFANRHPITDSLLGTKWKRRQSFIDTKLRNQKELADLLKTSMADPFSFEQQRIEVPAGESSVRLQVTIYPCLDANNVVKGKVVVAENLADRDDWQWRTVLGESTQRWTHRLKHQLGSARLMLGNVGEDAVVAGRIDNDPEFRDQWLSIDRQIVEAGASVTKILRYLRNPKPNLARCDVNDIVKAVSGHHALRECDEVTVSFLPTEGLPSVMGDRDQLCEVIDNLLTNARLAINGRGSVTISTRMAEHLLGIGKSEAIDVVIEDTGRGISETDMRRIWEAGFSRFPGGTGVGLALVKEIIDNHGGEITVSSEPGRGTRFVIRLPVSRE